MKNKNLTPKLSENRSGVRRKLECFVVEGRHIGEEDEEEDWYLN
jgi:hypothetical protein